jgi:hypothetical protein
MFLYCSKNVNISIFYSDGAIITCFCSHCHSLLVSLPIAAWHCASHSGNQPNLTIKLKIFIGQFQSANQSAAGGKVPHPKRLGRVVG